MVTNALLSDGCRVCVFDSFLYENNLCVLTHWGHPNFTFHYGDLRDLDALGKALVGVTDVILLAGLVGDPITKKYPELSDSINDRGMLSCIDHLKGRGLERVIFVSTCSNYGLIKDNELADENHPLSPLSSYAKSKVTAERHLLAGKGKVDYAPTILRFATAFGVAPRMRFDLTVNEFTRALARGEELLVFDAHTWRPYCHVRDFGRLIRTVIKAPREDVAFEIFNAGGDINNFTKQGVIDTILQHVPQGKVKYQQHGADPRNYRVSFEKVRTILGFEPEFTVRDGVVELLQAFDRRVFERAASMPNFHGNYEINDPWNGHG
jgi:nucleoside-diphosphate-sugar epimerase